LKNHIKNIFDNINAVSDDEVFEGLFANGKLKIERIISTGQSTPDGQYYEQDHDEWVALLSGAAVLSICDSAETGIWRFFDLKPGDYVFLPAMARHRVESTSGDEPTVWLALHF
jgi:cupin 2 domain-containing protein